MSDDRSVPDPQVSAAVGRLKDPRVGFVLLAVVVVVNLAHHTLWGDELQAWGLVRSSSGLSDLLSRLRGEGHPALWYLLLWPLSKLTADPVVLKVVQATVTLGWLSLVWFRSPFQWWEKALLCFSYPLSYDYALMARSYGVGLLLLFSFLAFSKELEKRSRLGWLLLGLLANLHFFLALVSLALAALWLEEKPERLRTMAPYLILLLLAGGTLAQTLIRGKGEATVLVLTFTNANLSNKIGVFGSAFVPFRDLGWHHFDSRLPNFPAFFVALAVAGALFVLLKRQPPLLMAMGGLSAAMVAFFYFMTGGYSWHGAIFFVFLVVLIWWARQRDLRLGPAWILTFLLVVNASGGLKAMVATYQRPLSNLETTAAWIEQEGLKDRFWIGYPAFPSAGLAACLNRPFYYLECDCQGLYADWAEQWMKPEQYPDLLEQALKRQPEVYLAVDVTFDQKLRQRLPESAVIEPLTRFEGAERENFVLYRLRHRERR